MAWYAATDVGMSAQPTELSNRPQSKLEPSDSRREARDPALQESSVSVRAITIGSDTDALLRDSTRPPLTVRSSDAPDDLEVALGNVSDRRRLGIPEGTQFHVLSFEGPDGYARIGGLETRVAGLCEALVAAGHETHLWFVGAPDAPGYEVRAGLHLHRWCQWLSAYHPAGVYDGEDNKVPDYAGSLPPILLHEWLLPHLKAGGGAVVMAEEWQTADALLHLDYLLRSAAPCTVRDQVRLFWNANNVFGFDRIDWSRLQSCALVTTVSRYMKQLMAQQGVEAVMLPNGLSPDAYVAPDRNAVHQLRKLFAGRIAITKMARWDPDKNWLGSIDIIAHMKSRGLRPLLIARGGLERHGQEVLRAMRRAGLRIAERAHGSGMRAFVEALANSASVDVLNVTRHVDRDSRRALFRASDVVLANSAKEPFGLVGLEAMAVGGIGCTGLTGEDYVMPGRNALVLQTSDPAEFVKLYLPLRADPEYEAAMRRAGRATARQYAWPEVIRTALAPRLGLSS
jgi:glycosyltransferase involved in cell wall biosynthesis